MKTLKAICTATILALTLSVPAYAGDIDTPGCANPGPGSTAQALIGTTTPSADAPAIVDLLWVLAGLF